MIDWLIPDKPDAIYGALVGGIIALLVSSLTNAHSRKRQKIDLAYQADQKERERLLNLKRDTYIPLLEASSVAVNFVAQIPTVHIDVVKTSEPLVNLGKQVTRISLIAPPSVLEPVSLGVNHLMSIASLLLMERLKLEKLTGDLSVLSSQVQWHLDNQKSQNLRFERLMDEGNQDQSLLDHIQQLAENSHVQIQQLFEQQQTLISQKAQTELELGKKAAHGLLPIATHSIKSLIAIRNELHLPIDEEWLTGFQQKNSQHAIQVVNNLHEFVTQAVSEPPLEQTNC